MHTNLLARMDLIRVFHAVAETMSMTRASQALFITQPAVSHAIRQLEEHLRCRLFRREHRQLFLTEQGKALFAASTRIHNELRSVKGDIDAISNLKAGILRIGTTRPLGWLAIGPTVTALMREHPDIRMRLMIGTVRDCLEWLDQSVIDAAYVNCSYAEQICRQEGLALSFHPVRRSRDVFIAGIAYEELRGKPLSFADIAHLPIIAGPTGHGLRIYLERLCRGIDREFRPSIECNEMETMVELTEKGLGLALCTEDVVRAEIASGRQIFVLDVNLNGTDSAFGFAWKTSRHPPAALTVLMDRIAKSAAEPNDSEF